MSVRVYSGPHADRRRGPSALLRALPWVLAFATILAEIAYPLVEGDNRRTLTVVTVALFFLASVTHALVWRGPAWTLGYLVITVGGGLARRGGRGAHRLAVRRLRLRRPRQHRGFGVPGSSRWPGR